MLIKSKALKRRDYLSLLARSKGKKKRNLLAQLADKEDMDALSECTLNFLKGHLPVSGDVLRRLRYHKSALRELSRKRTPLKRKREIVSLRGGFLSFLLPLALDTISSLFTKK